MFLAGCMKTFKEEIICDLAETYGIYDYESHPIKRVAIFVKGLRENSRLMRKLSKTNYSKEDLYFSSIIDNLNLLLWTKTKDAEKNKNKPKRLLDSLIVKDRERKSKTFVSSKDFEEERKEILSEIKKGGIN